jgi:hypothetical protein
MAALRSTTETSASLPGHILLIDLAGDIDRIFWAPNAGEPRCHRHRSPKVLARIEAVGADLVSGIDYFDSVRADCFATPIFHGGHPSGVAETLATVVGLIGAGGLLVFVVLLQPYELGFSVNAPATYRALWDKGMLEQPMVDLALADAFEEQREANARAVRRLVRFLGVALGALVLETAGLAAAAALAS